MLQKLGKLMTVLWNGYFSQCIMSLGDGCINCIKLPLFLRIFLVVLFFGETWNYNPGSLDRCLHYLLGSSQEGRTAMMADIGDFFMENDCLIGFLNIVQCRIQERPTLPLPLFLDQTEARRSKKKLFETEPTLISGSGWRYTGRFVKKGGFGPIGCLPFTCSENWSVHGLGKGKAKFRTGKFRPGIAFAPAPVPAPIT